MVKWGKGPSAFTTENEESKNTDGMGKKRQR